jgi:hypothetical protein
MENLRRRGVERREIETLRLKDVEGERAAVRRMELEDRTELLRVIDPVEERGMVRWIDVVDV